MLPELKAQLISLDEPLINELANKLVDLSHITELIDQAIVDNPPLTVKEGGIIKDSFNGSIVLIILIPLLF